MSDLQSMQEASEIERQETLDDMRAEEDAEIRGEIEAEEEVQFERDVEKALGEAGHRAMEVERRAHHAELRVQYQEHLEKIEDMQKGHFERLGKLAEDHVPAVVGKLQGAPVGFNAPANQRARACADTLRKWADKSADGTILAGVYEAAHQIAIMLLLQEEDRS